MYSGYKIYWALIGFATLYAFFKQRQEYGCEGTFFTTERQCIDEKSVYFADTAPDANDTMETLTRKMTNILSYHEKSGMWKICLVMAGILSLFIYIFYPHRRDGDFVSLHLTFFVCLTFFFDFINFHHFRRLKAVGESILVRMNKKCKQVKN